jgi:hypothetical protein
MRSLFQEFLLPLVLVAFNYASFSIAKNVGKVSRIREWLLVCLSVSIFLGANLVEFLTKTTIGDVIHKSEGRMYCTFFEADACVVFKVGEATSTGAFSEVPLSKKSQNIGPDPLGGLPAKASGAQIVVVPPVETKKSLDEKAVLPLQSKSLRATAVGSLPASAEPSGNLSLNLAKEAALPSIAQEPPLLGMPSLSKVPPQTKTDIGSVDTCKKSLDTDIAAQKRVRLAMQFGDQCAYGKARTVGMWNLREQRKDCLARPEMQETLSGIEFEIDKALIVWNEHNCQDIDDKYKLAYAQVADHALDRALKKPVQSMGGWTLEFRPPTYIRGLLRISNNPYLAGLEQTCGEHPDTFRVRPLLKDVDAHSIVLVTDETIGLRTEYGYFDQDSQTALFFAMLDMRTMERKIGVHDSLTPVSFSGARDVLMQLVLLCRKQNGWGLEPGYASVKQ